MIKATYKSNVASFLNKFNSDKISALNSMGEVGVVSISSETPIDTGILESDNDYKVTDNKLFFYNNTPYASYVELGTYKQSANPFMRRGINKAKTGMLKALIANLKV